jgi:hypothetical protein
MDPHHCDRLHPEPDPHQFEDDKPKCMEYKPILALFKGLSLYLEARIWIQSLIRIRVKKTNPDPHQNKIRILIRIRIRIR